MIVHKKEFTIGVVMLAAFIVVLIIVFSPVFNGKNGLEYLDDLYNSISKGSAYFIPKIKEETAKYSGYPISVFLEMETRENAEQSALLFMKSGAMIAVSGTELKIEGDLGGILSNCLADADSMYHNDGKAISEKYGYDEKQVLFNWWNALKKTNKALTKQESFDAAKAVTQVLEKSVETSYNYYRVQPQKISERVGIVAFSLVFYVIYTVWYGFSIMYIFTGIGLKLEH